MIRRAWRGAVGIVLGVVARAWLATLRVSVEGAPPETPRPWVLSFFHGTQFPLLGWKRRTRTCVLVSLSADGDIQARALPRVGLVVRRGSSSRGGVRGLLSLVREMRRGLDAAFAVDGPRGPRGVVKEGAVVAARRAHGLLVPMGAHARHAIVLRRAWDRFFLPLPFTRVAVVVGDPVEPERADARETLERAIEAANARARHALEAVPVRVAERA